MGVLLISMAKLSKLKLEKEFGMGLQSLKLMMGFKDAGSQDMAIYTIYTGFTEFMYHILL